MLRDSWLAARVPPQVSQLDFPQWKFSLYFLVSATDAELRAGFERQAEDVRKGATTGGTGRFEDFDPLLPNQVQEVTATGTASVTATLPLVKRPFSHEA
jgi:hypothetical protein